MERINMRKSTWEFKVITEKFIDKFSFYWNDVIRTIDVQGEQLKIGNRLRPQMCLWGYLVTIQPNQYFSCDYSVIANLAVSIEMIHKASLLIDDWIDDDSERHGVPAFHVEYTPQQAILLALNLIGVSMNRLKDVFSNKAVLPHNYYLCLNQLIKTVYAMAKGALEELQLSNIDAYNYNKVNKIIQLEVSEILGNSLLLGYYAGAGDSINPQIEIMFKEIGDKCGYLFQAYNDLEAFACPEKLIRHKGNLNLDFQLNRKNIAVTALFEMANSKDRSALQSFDEDIIIQMMNKYHVVDTIIMELENLFLDLQGTCDHYNVIETRGTWSDCFREFLINVKKFAESRLR